MWKIIMDHPHEYENFHFTFFLFFMSFILFRYFLNVQVKFYFLCIYFSSPPFCAIFLSNKKLFFSIRVCCHFAQRNCHQIYHFMEINDQMAKIVFSFSVCVTTLLPFPWNGFYWILKCYLKFKLMMFTDSE